MNRRGFLKILTATIAAPVIARAAIIPDLILPPGIERVPEVTKPMIATGDARFATAVFTPGGMIQEIAAAMRMRCPLPPGTLYQIRALQMSGAELHRAGGRAIPRTYRHGGYAVMWVTDASMQRGECPQLAGSDLLGTYKAGDCDWMSQEESAARLAKAIRDREPIGRYEGFSFVELGPGGFRPKEG